MGKMNNEEIYDDELLDDEDYEPGESEESASEIAADIAKKVLRLIVKCVRWTLRTLWVVVRFIIKWTIIGCQKLWQLMCEAWAAWLVYWHKPETQEKVAEAKRTLRRWAKAAVRYTWMGIQWMAVHTWIAIKWMAHYGWIGAQIAAHYIWIGTKWAARHGWAATKWTARFTWKWTKRGAIALWGLMRRLGSLLKLWGRRKAEDYREFQRTKGFKGLYMDGCNWVSRTAHDYMRDEDSLETDYDATEETEDNTEKEEDEEEGQDTVVDTDLIGASIDEESKVGRFGRRVYDTLNLVVGGADDDEKKK